jgi:hypothetical protein
MARYSAFLGRRVEVHYRAGDIVLPASGTFVADSGRSIFLEQHLMQRGQQKQFRWEIPYQYIVSLEERPDAEAASAAPDATSPSKDTAEARKSSTRAEASKSSGTGARASADLPVVPLPNRPKTA